MLQLILSSEGFLFIVILVKHSLTQLDLFVGSAPEFFLSVLEITML